MNRQLLPETGPSPLPPLRNNCNLLCTLPKCCGQFHSERTVIHVSHSYPKTRTEKIQIPLLLPQAHHFCICKQQLMRSFTGLPQSKNISHQYTQALGSEEAAYLMTPSLMTGFIPTSPSLLLSSSCPGRFLRFVHQKREIHL